MGWRGTVVLGVALCGAAYLLYREVAGQDGETSWRSVFELPRPTPPGEQITRLLSFDPASVTGVRVSHRGSAWSLQRTADGWQGAQRPGDANDFLKSLQDLAEIMPMDVTAGELADHGLDPPASTVEVDRTDGPPLVLLVGRRNPPATGVYVQVGRGGPVVLTGALLLWELDKATRAFAPASEEEGGRRKEER